MNTAVPPGNCVTHGYHGLAACPRCSSSTLPAAPISAGQAHAAVSPFDLVRRYMNVPGFSRIHQLRIWGERRWPGQWIGMCFCGRGIRCNTREAADSFFISEGCWQETTRDTTETK